MKTRTRFKKGMKGFMLLEMSLTLIILSIVGIIALQKQSEDLIDLRVFAQATALQKLQGALNAYIVSAGPDLATRPVAQYGAALSVTIDGTTANVPNGNKPTINDLIALKLLPTGFKDIPLIGGNYMMQANQETGCTPPNCKINGLVWITQPLVNDGYVDGPRLGHAAKLIGIDTVYSTDTNTNTMTGLNGTNPTPNPQGAVAGIIGVLAGDLSSLNNQFYRLDGSKPAQLFITAPQTSGAACTKDKAIASGSGTGLNAVLVCSGGTWKPFAGTFANVGDVCPNNGTTATSNAATAETLVCRNGKYMKISDLMDKYVVMSKQLVADGQEVIKPVCATGGLIDYTITVNRFRLDLTGTTSPKPYAALVGSLNPSTIAPATQWTFSLKIIDPDGNAKSIDQGFSDKVYATVTTECYYP